MKVHGKIIKIDMHTLRAAAERVERSGGRMELTSFGVAVQINEAVQVVPWLIINTATSNIIDEAITKIINDDTRHKLNDNNHKDITNTKHKGLRIESDEYVCSDCGKRWGVDDPDVPGCV